MRMLQFIPGLLVCTLACLPLMSHAERVSVEMTGEVAEVVDTTGLLNGKVTVGKRAVIRFSYDDALAPNNVTVDNSFAFYSLLASAGGSYSVTIDGHVFQLNPEKGVAALNVGNDQLGSDILALEAYADAVRNPQNLQFGISIMDMDTLTMRVSLYDDTAQVLGGLALPQGLDLAAWQTTPDKEFDGVLSEGIFLSANSRSSHIDTGPHYWSVRIRPTSARSSRGSTSAPAPTPAGTDVAVVTTAGLPDGSTLPASFSFDSVEAPGETTVTASQTGQEVPSGFKLGDPPIFYDISTTATFSGSVTVCLGWTGNQYDNESSVRLWHMEGGAWQDVTTSVNVETRQVCGRVTSFSPFVITESAYRFDGFFQPVDKHPAVNSVKAGSAIPVKFSLGGNHGTDIFGTGGPKVRTVACPTSGTQAPVEEVVAGASANALSYDAASDRYTFVWKTEKSWAGGCRQLQLNLKDGSLPAANFSFTR